MPRADAGTAGAHPACGRCASDDWRRRGHWDAGSVALAIDRESRGDVRGAGCAFGVSAILLVAGCSRAPARPEGGPLSGYLAFWLGTTGRLFLCFGGKIFFITHFTGS